jgi:hypothetical protein
MEIFRKKNTATRIFFPIVDADGDYVSGASGLDSEYTTFADGSNPGAFADCTNEATEVGSTGWYYLNLTATETNADFIAVQIKTSTSGAKTQGVLINTLYGAAKADSSGRVDVGSWLGTAVTTNGTTNKPEVDVSAISGDSSAADNLEADYDGTGYVFEDGTAQAGASTSITLAAGSSSVTDYYKHGLIYLVSGTGSGQPGRVCTAYNGSTKVATVTPAWATTPDNTSKYIFQPWGYVPGVAAAGISEIQSGLATSSALSSLETKVDTVDSVADAILVDTGTSGVVVASNNDKVGYSLASGAIDSTIFAANSITASALAADAGTEIANAIKAAIVETQGNYTVQQVLSVLLAAVAGVTSDSGATLKTPNGSATRVAATINGSNERTAMTLTPSS